MDANSVAQIVRLYGGELIGKTRLQKCAYFLESKGAGFGFDFSYHHFGPYSEELTNCTDDATALKLIDVDWKQTKDGLRYAVFHCKHSDPTDRRDKYRHLVLGILKKYSSVEIELAATADFLKNKGHNSDPWVETCRRKATKVNEARLAKSKQLLGELESI